MPEPFAFVPGAVAQTGRVALVTGGEAGLGAAVVRALAATGHAVAIHAHAALGRARDLADQLAGVGVPCLALTADLREEGPMRTLVHRVADRFGRIDALVTCAGVAREGRLEDVTADDLRMHFDVNCIGTFVAVQEAAALMTGQESGGGIVLVGCAAGEPPPSARLAARLVQEGIPTMARCLAAECAARNPRVRVNCVLPGPVAAAATDYGRETHAILFLLENDGVSGACLAVAGGPTPSGPAAAAVRSPAESP